MFFTGKAADFIRSHIKFHAPFARLHKVASIVAQNGKGLNILTPEFMDYIYV